MRKRLIAAAAIAALSVAGLSATAAGGSASDPAEDSAAAAALAAVPGDLLEVEAEDDGRQGFEVEIRTADGDVEVHVDLDGNVVGIDPGDDGPGDESE
jgi:outer membrane lipoprotein SlyB